MIETEFRTEDLPTAERFAHWHEMTVRALVATVVHCDDVADFRATVRMLDLGAVQVSEMTFPSLHVDRPAKLVRQSDPEQYQLSLILRGNAGMAHAGREALLGAGDFVLYDTSRPFHGRTVVDGGDMGAELKVQFPKALLPLHPNTVDRLIATRLSAREGMGALLSAYLKELTRHTARYRPVDAARLATIALDLLAAWCAHELDTSGSLPPETHHRALLARIHDFIRQRLGDPALSPGLIAAAHQISTRYLHKIFHDQGLTVAGWIRQRRLERCHRDLADPVLRSHPIHAIATRWGFSDSAHFSRLFRAAYGTSPRDYRHLARQGNDVRASSTTVHSLPTTS